jgi:hypothetical protein
MIRTGMLIWSAVAFLILAALWLSPNAKADPVDNYAIVNGPRVCTVLDVYPSFPGIEGLSQAIVSETGWGYREAGRIIAEAVTAFCPAHAGLLVSFAGTYAPGVGVVA